MLKTVATGEGKVQGSVSSLMPKLFYVVSAEGAAVYKGAKRQTRFPRRKGQPLTSCVTKAKGVYSEMYTHERTKALRVFDSLIALRQRKEMQAAKRKQEQEQIKADLILDSIFGVMKSVKDEKVTSLVERLKKVKVSK